MFLNSNILHKKCVENPYILCGPNNLELFMSDVLIFNGNVTVIQGL